MALDSSPVDPVLAESIRFSAAALRTRVGVLRVVASEDRVLCIELPGTAAMPFAGPLLRGRRRSRGPALDAALSQLREYFSGARRRFSVRVAPTGTDFQQRVWRAIAAIPFGETRTYGELAAALGGPPLARAVGAATAANPIPILIPCHRVIGADGSLTGYGGGLRMKVWLLHHEGVLLA